MIQGFSKRSNVSIDIEGEFFFGPDIYGLKIREEFCKYYPLVLGILNSSITNFFICHIGVIHGSGYYKFEDRFTKKLPIKLPQTPKEEKLAEQITDKVDIILSQVKIEQRIEGFPDLYLEEMQGIELDELVHTFQTNHKSLEPEITELVDGGYGIVLGKKEEPINVETKERAEYVAIALKGKKAKKVEKIKILIPKDEENVKEILKKYKQDKKKLEEMSIAKLEEEINELVHDLYGLNEEDKKVIEDFLQKF